MTRFDRKCEEADYCSWLHAVTLSVLTAYPATLVLWAGRQGPGMWSDSVNYAFGARSFALVGEVNGWWGGPLTLWPPGLPMLLGSLVRLGFDLEVAAVCVNALCVASMVVLTFGLARAVLGSSTLGLLAAGLVGISSSTLRVYAWLASECPFVVLTLLVLLLCVESVRVGTWGWERVVWIGALVSVATIFRIAGLWLLPLAVLVAAMVTHRTGWRRALTLSAATAVLGTVGLVLVALRNVSVGAPPLGVRVPSPLSAPSLVTGTVATLGRYVVPFDWTVSAVVVGLGVAGLLAGSLILAWRGAQLLVLLVGSFAALYLVLLTYSQIATSVSPTNARLAAPAFSPLVIAVIYAARELARRMRPRTAAARAVRAVSGLMVMSAIAVSLVEGPAYAHSAASQGLGYNSIDSRSSQLALALRDLPSEAAIAATDDAKAAWVTGRLIPMRLPMLERGGQLGSIDQSITSVIRHVNDGTIEYLAFFNDPGTNSSATLHALVAAGVRIRQHSRFEDGSLWIVEAPS